MSKFRIFLSPPDVGAEERELLNDAFDSNWIAPLGPHVDAFEAEMCTRLGVSSAVALSSGTAALHLALKVLGIGRGDAVLCSSLTFAASANPIIYQGGVPIFIDSEESSWNICPAALQLAIDSLTARGVRPKALVAVNLYGQSAAYGEILPICERNGIHVVEDAAESLGASYQGRASGSFGVLSALSFNGNKIITTSGGGMLVSSVPAWVDRARYLSTQARDPVPYYQHRDIGYNYRLSNLLAAVGRAQLKGLDGKVARRRRIFERYVEGLQDLPGIGFMPELAGGVSSRWLSVMVLDPSRAPFTRDRLISGLGAAGIEARPVWKPMHLQPVFSGCEFFSATATSVAERLFESGVCLPSGSSLSDGCQDEVIGEIRRLAAVSSA
jgi:pyridoxal phosphate-dependent aminotransferase EpsN